MKRTRFFTLLLALLLCVSVLCMTAYAESDAWDGRSSAAFADGDGSERNPYQIANGAQLYYLTLQSDTNHYYVLTDDINLGNQPFPIINTFSGVLDGAYHKILGLNITGDSGSAAMISTCTGMVRNLSVYGAVSSTGSYTASIAGSLSGGTIENCVNYCTVSSESDRSDTRTGGLVGYLSNKGQIINCANLANVQGQGYVGGIAGGVSNGDWDTVPSITGCQNAATISGKIAGGICASQGGTIISECVNSGSVTGSSASGGIVGTSYSRNCIVVSKINGSTKRYSQICSSHIHDCYNTGSIVGGATAGGIVSTFAYCTYRSDGWHQSNSPSMSLTHCYNVGKVSSTNEPGTSGDIVGGKSASSTDSNGVPEKCLYLIDNNPNATDSQQSLATPCSELQLSTAAIYSNNGFDFSTVWAWDNSGSYPYAILQRIGLPKSICEHNYALTSNTATCLDAGVATYTCSKCGDSYTEEAPPKGHTPADAVRENEVPASCSAAGSYDEVIYCSVCSEEISRTQKTIEKLPHTPADAVRENEVPASCSAAGSYDEVIYCSVCSEEISRTAKTIEKLPHDFSGNREYCANGCGTKNPNYIPPRRPSHGSQVKPTPTKPEKPKNPFKDVSENDYFYDAVLWAVDKDITSGTSATIFDANKNCTRAEMVTFLWRAAGKPEPTNRMNPFTDVKEDSYYYKAVLWAVENGITKGTSDTTFSPNDTCTRGQTATFLYRYAGSPAVSGRNYFNDVNETDYYYDAVVWAASEGITTGTSATTFSPADFSTRGQIVTFLYRYLKN